MKAKRLLALGLSLALAATTVLASPGATGVVRAAGETEYDRKISDVETLKYVAVDNLIYALKTDDNTAVLAGFQYAKDFNGDLDEGYYRGGTTVNIPSTITYGDATYTVDQIGGYVMTKDGDTVDFPGFGSCQNIEKVVMPDTIKTIGSTAFGWCSALKEVTFSKSLVELGYGAFESCYALESANLPDSITKIYSEVFSGCEALKTAHIPASIDDMREGVFDGCFNLESITLGKGNTNGYSIDKNGALVKSDDYGIELVAYPFASSKNVFDVYNGLDLGWRVDLSYAKNLSAFTVTDNKNYKVDGEGVLYENNRLACYPMAKSNTSYTVMDGTKSVGSSAFSIDVPLTELILPASVESVSFGWVPLRKLQKYVVNEGNEDLSTSPDGVLLNADGTGIISVPAGKEGSYTIPSTVTSIGEYAFAYTGLSEITVPSSVSEIGSDGFLGTSAKKINLPEGIVSIPDNAFRNCKNLETIVLPSTLEAIGKNAFNGCSALTQISLPESLTTIEMYAFQSCSGLTEITIPGSVNSIGEYSFNRCYNLKKVTINPGTDPSVERTIGERTFLGNRKLVIYSIPANMTIGEYAIGVSDINYNDDVNILESNISISTELSTPKITYVTFRDKYNATWTPTIYGVAGSPAETYAAATNGGVKFSTEAAPTVLPEDSEKSSSGETTPNSGTNTNTDTPTTGGAINPSSSGGGGGGGSSAGTTTTKKNADGSSTTTNVVKTSAGTTTTASTTYPDGSKKVVKTVEKTDGSKVVTETNTKKDGSKTVAEVSISAAGNGTLTTTTTDASGKETAKAAYSVSGKKLALNSIEGGKSIVIPATVTVSGTKYKVTKIAAGAMKGNTTMTKVQIGKNVTAIGKNAFSGNKNLKTIVIKGKVTSIGKNAFKGISKKAVIKVSATKKNFTKIKKAIKKSGIAKTVTIKRTK